MQCIQVQSYLPGENAPPYGHDAAETLPMPEAMSNAGPSLLEGGRAETNQQEYPCGGKGGGLEEPPEGKSQMTPVWKEGPEEVKDCGCREGSPCAECSSFESYWRVQEKEERDLQRVLARCEHLRANGTEVEEDNRTLFYDPAPGDDPKDGLEEAQPEEEEVQAEKPHDVPPEEEEVPAFKPDEVPKDEPPQDPSPARRQLVPEENPEMPAKGQMTIPPGLAARVQAYQAHDVKLPCILRTEQLKLRKKNKKDEKIEGKRADDAEEGSNDAKKKTERGRSTRRTSAGKARAKAKASSKKRASRKRNAKEVETDGNPGDAEQKMKKGRAREASQAKEEANSSAAEAARSGKGRKRTRCTSQEEEPAQAPGCSSSSPKPHEPVKPVETEKPKRAKRAPKAKAKGKAKALPKPKASPKPKAKAKGEPKRKGRKPKVAPVDQQLAADDAIVQECREELEKQWRSKKPVLKSEDFPNSPVYTHCRLNSYWSRARPTVGIKNRSVTKGKEEEFAYFSFSRSDAFNIGLAKLLAEKFVGSLGLKFIAFLFTLQYVTLPLRPPGTTCCLPRTVSLPILRLRRRSKFSFGQGTWQLLPSSASTLRFSVCRMISRFEASSTGLTF